MLPEYLNTTSWFLDENLAQGRGDRVAVCCEGRRVTYGELSALTNRVGNALKSLGVEMENRVYIAMGDSPEYVASFYAVQKIGAGAINGYTNASVADYAYELELLRPKVVIADASCIARLREAAGDGPWPRAFVVREAPPVGAREHDFETLVAGASEALQAERTHRDDFARWGFTGGSTGRPKAMPISHAVFPHCFESLQGLLDLRESDVVLSVPKMFFGYGRTSTIVMPFRAGACAVLFPQQSTPERLFELIARHRPTILVNVPTMMRKMLQTPPAQRADLSCVRLCLSAGEALPADLHQEWQATFGTEVVNMLGSTEMGYVYAASRPGESAPGSVGRPLPGFEVKLLDAAGHEVADGEVGTLAVKGPTAGFFYWHRAEESRAVFRGEWVHTSDLFRRDARGDLWFTGRANDMIKVSGSWVSPLEVEQVLLTHPEVADCAVVGIADADGLDRLKAFVVLRGGAHGSPGKGDELRAYVRSRASAHKAPRIVEFVSDLPKSAVGKVDRAALRGAHTA